MEFIIADKNKNETGMLTDFNSLDIDLKTLGDFELKMDIKTADKYGIGFGSYIFSNKTEFGGVIENLETNTNSDEIIYKGSVFRNLLNKDIIKPPENEDYKIVSGEANSIIRDILEENNAVGIFFNGSTELSGITITNYQFDRYVTTLNGLKKMLLTKNARLDIRAKSNNMEEKFSVIIKATPITDYSEEIEYSQDEKINVNFKDNRNGINHLVALGRGELSDREVIDLYVQEDGTIGDNKYYTGIDERIEIYDYPNAESSDELNKSAVEKLLELANKKEVNLSVNNFDIDIGDIIGGRDYRSGTVIKKPVTGKIYRCQAEEKIEVSVEDEVNVEEKGDEDENSED